MLHMQGRASVLGDIPAEISRRHRGNFGDLPQGSGEISSGIPLSHRKGHRTHMGC